MFIKSNGACVQLSLVENPHTTPPGHQCSYYHTHVENVVGVAKVIKDEWKSPFRPLHCEDTSSKNVKTARQQKDPRWELSHILFFHIEDQMNDSRDS